MWIFSSAVTGPINGNASEVAAMHITKGSGKMLLTRVGLLLESVSSHSFY